MTAPATRATESDLSSRPQRPPGQGSNWVSGRVLIPALIAGLVLAIVAGVGMGAFAIPPEQLVSSLLHRIGIDVGTRPDRLAEEVLWQIRLPRVALTVLVGLSLGCAGASMQGTFSNPLAEPGIVGVSSGAVIGVVGQIVLGIHFAGSWTITIAAFAGGFATVFIVYLASWSDGRTEVVTLVLTGIAVNALVGAVIGLLLFYTDDAELRTITFWTLGSMAQATWGKVLVVLPLAVLGLILAGLYSRQLDLLSLGERSAAHLGVDVERLRLIMLAVVAMLTAAAVAVSGILMFVGLVIPHLVRMIAGPGHRLLLPASALAGAAILVLADLVARTIAAPAELPLGVLTSLVGSPFFFWQLRRTRRRQGGWA